jgi:hypothetical protein
VIEVVRAVADNVSAIGVLRINRVAMPARVLDPIVDELGRCRELDVFTEVDRIVIFSVIDPSRSVALYCSG